MKIWLRAVATASARSPDFAAWCARNVMKDKRIGGNRNGTPVLDDIVDWVTASLRAGVPEHIRRAFGAARASRGEEYITRVFSKDMSLATVLQLSDEWHEAVAANMNGPQCQFPPSWFPAQLIEGYELVPIETAADLYLEGKLMHHCVGTYAERVKYGATCIFSVRSEGERVATVAFTRRSSGLAIDQIRGPCNAAVPVIENAIRKWLRKQPVPELPKQPIPAWQSLCTIEDEDIPF